MLEHATPQALTAMIAVLAAILGGNAWITSALIDKKLKDLDKMYVRTNECLLRCGNTRDLISADRADTQKIGNSAALRDDATQKRIDAMVQSIATRAAESVLRDREVLGKIDELLRILQK